MLVVTGLQDIVAVPQNALNIALSRPDTRLIGLADCGHNMIAEQPDELVTVLVEHIRRHARNPPQSTPSSCECRRAVRVALETTSAHHPAHARGHGCRHCCQPQLFWPRPR